MASAQSASNILLLKLSENENAITVSDEKMLTKGSSYHNQPFFYQNESLLYTAQQADGNTEIMQHDLLTGKRQNLTNTSDSEYSAYVTPDGKSFVSVRVESDGKQRLWQYYFEGNASPHLVFEEIAPVGYFAINASGDVLMFVLGRPNRLQLANLSDAKVNTLGKNVGRTFRVVPGTNDFVLQQNGEDSAAIYTLKMADRTLHKVVDLPAKATDWTITQKGTYLTTLGSEIWAYHPERNDKWQLVKDIGEAAKAGMSRMAVNRENSYLAIVVNH